MLYFITSNKEKLAEIKTFLPQVEQLDIDLPEIQHLNAHEIIKHKFKEALQYHEGQFLIEDTSLHLHCLNGFPGPLIKWFLKAIGNEGIYQIVEELGNNRAEAKAIIGYAIKAQEIRFFKGSVRGTIVPPRGEMGFGWDSIFQPDGHAKTFAEMTREEKNDISMRRIALNKFKEFINTATNHDE